MNLSKCNLQIIPNSIKELTNLSELFLYGNKIAVLPQEIGQLTQLTTLAVRNFFNAKFWILMTIYCCFKSLHRIHVSLK